MSRLLVFLMTISAGAGPAAAQSLGIRVVGADIKHHLVGGLLGAGIVGTVPLRSAGIDVELGGEHLVGSSARFGIPCAGLIEPGTCEATQLRDNATSTSLSAGLKVPAVGADRLALRLGGGLAASYVRSRTRALTSAHRLSANKAMWRAEIGVEGAWHPWRSAPISLAIGGAAGWQSPIRTEIVLDGYTPFEEGFRVARAWLGLTWRRGAR